MRRNYVLQGLEGGVYIGGLAFIASDSVMPTMMASMGAPAWVISLTPMMSTIGFSLPPLFMAHRVEGLRHVMPLVRSFGLVQRLPYLIAALALLTCWPGHPVLAWGMAALAPLASGLAGGVGYVAWQELIAKSVSPNRVPSMHALRYLISGVIGIAAGPIISRVLLAHPGPPGYARLHLIAFVFLLVSYALFCRIRELDVAMPGRRALPSLRASLAGLPALWRDDIRLRALVWVRILHSGVLVMTPFLAAHVLAVTGRPESYVGVLVTAQMAGAIAGNLVAGWLGDRHGGWQVVSLSRWLLSATCVLMVVNRLDAGFVATFFLYGFAMTTNFVGMNALYLQICPVPRRPTYLALIAAVNVPAMLLAAAGSTLFRHLTASIVPAGLMALICVQVSLRQLRQLKPAAPLLAAILALFAGSSWADTVRLRNGQSVEGIVTRETAADVRLDLGIASTAFSRGTVRSIEYATSDQNDRIRTGWRQKYYLHKQYLPAGMEDLAARFTELRARREDALLARQSMASLRNQEAVLKGELDANNARLIEASRRVRDASPGRDTQAYNALIIEHNALSTKVQVTTAELAATRKALEAAAGRARAYQDEMVAFESRLKEQEGRLGAAATDADRRYVCHRIASVLSEYTRDFVTATVPLAPSGAGAVVVAVINDRVQGQFVVDTGSSMVVISEAFARRLELDTRALPESSFTMADGSKAKGKVAVVDSMQVGDARAERIEVAVFQAAAAPGVDGLLGMSFLSRFLVHLDGSTGKLELMQFAP